MTINERRAIADIRIGARHRKEMGDLAKLAESIKQEGLLQPIGVLADNTLVFGERRLRACRDILGWTEIDVRMVNVTSIVAGEMHENEMRKAFTPSERVAIFRTISTIAKHRAFDTDKKGRPGGEVLSIPTLLTVEETSKLAGFAGRGTAYRATTVVDCGLPEVVQAMDDGIISITAAEGIAKQPKAEQPAKLAEAIDASRKKPAQQHKSVAPTPKPKAPRPDRSRIVPKSRGEKLPTLSAEEVGLPENPTFEQRAAHQEKYGKAQFTPKRIRDMNDNQATVDEWIAALLALTSEHRPAPDKVAAALSEMLAWTTDQRKPHFTGDGWETDYAKRARAQLAKLATLMPKAMRLLAAHEQAWGERRLEGSDSMATLNGTTSVSLEEHHV